MSQFVALLRAVNVGGTGKLAMSELRALCEDAGFTSVSTYIQSGNVVFESRSSEAAVKKKLEKVLQEKMGKPVSVLVRTAAQLASVSQSNPFPDTAPNQVLVLFLDSEPPATAFEDLKVPGREAVQVKGREVFIHYPDGMGRSKLKLPLTGVATGRNMNTVAKLVDMVNALAAKPSV